MKFYERYRVLKWTETRFLQETGFLRVYRTIEIAAIQTKPAWAKHMADATLRDGRMKTLILLTYYCANALPLQLNAIALIETQNRAIVSLWY